MKTKSFERKKELLEAALDEFIVKSYEEASLNSIIRRAGISKGTFYYHFKDKQELYFTLLRSTVDAELEFMERKLKNYSRNEDLNIFENLKLQARFGAEFAKEYPKYCLFGMMFRKEQGNDIYKAAMEMLGGTTETYIEDLVEKAVKRGDFRDGVPAPFAKRMLTFLMNRYDELFDIREEEYSIDRMLHDFDLLIDFMQHGLGKK